MLSWHGKQVLDAVERATAGGIDTTTARAVHRAKSSHPWRNRTGILEGSIRSEAAVKVGKQLRGRWGSWDVTYALPLEEGFDGQYRWLRPAADATYPGLEAAIRALLGGRR